MKAVFLVPRRRDNGHRDKLWAWCRRRWEALMPDVKVVEGHHDDGPFNRSAAINTASRLAGDWDVAVVIDSDVFLSVEHVRAAITSAAEGKVTWAHRRWRGVSEGDTNRLIKDPDTFGEDPDASRDMDLIVERTTPISWSCCMAIPRTTFDDMGGFDERFQGWGFEDGAIAALIRAKYPWTRIDGDIFHWYHPRSDERIVKGEPGITARPEYVRNALLGRRYMIAAIRDYASGDQPGEERLTPEKVKVHVSNLTKDDARFLAFAEHLRMPEAAWRTWWPTLEELQAGARGHVAGDPPTVTLIVHTDGRRDYIARSIPSLLANVTGPIAKRVIFDDSGDPAYKAWLRETFPGFYVVGPEARLGQAGSMKAMWSYLDRKCSTAYVLQVEDDFLYDRPVDLEPMIDTLDANPQLRQMALLREPYFARELEAGSIIAEHPESYELRNSRPHPFLEHRLYFTFNPSLFRRSLCKLPMPETRAEPGFTAFLNRDPDSRFGLWGSGEPWITHIGAERSPAAVGY